jgi:hypothetical protein
VFLSLSANPPVEMRVTIFTQAGSVFLGSINVDRGRTGIGRQIQPGDLAAFIEFIGLSFQAAAAFVEYSTP